MGAVVALMTSSLRRYRGKLQSLPIRKRQQWLTLVSATGQIKRQGHFHGQALLRIEGDITDIQSASC